MLLYCFMIAFVALISVKLHVKYWWLNNANGSLRKAITKLEHIMNNVLVQNSVKSGVVLCSYW